MNAGDMEAMMQIRPASQTGKSGEHSHARAAAGLVDRDWEQGVWVGVGGCCSQQDDAESVLQPYLAALL